MKPKTKTTIAQIGVIIFLATFAALSAGAQTTTQNTQKIQKVCIGIKATNPSLPKS